MGCISGPVDVEKDRHMRVSTGMCWYSFTVLLGLGGLCLALGGGCNGAAPQAPQARGAAASPTPDSTPEKAADPLLEGWDQPAAVLLLSGEQQGYLEPCGCSITQSGGLARRASLEAMLREKGWPVVGLDAGGLVKDSETQDKLKFETILAGLKQLNYAAVAAGVAELRLNPDYLLGQFLDAEGIPLAGMLVSANVVFHDDPGLGVPKAFRIVTAGDVKIGVTAVLGAKAASEVAPEGVQTNMAVKPAADALKDVLPKLAEQQPDVLVLLVHGTPAEARSLAEKFPQFPIVLNTGGAEEASERPVKVGNTLVLEVGHKGKHIGVLGFFPNSETKFRWELVNLDNRRFLSDPRMTQLMRDYQQRVRDLNLAESDDRKVQLPGGLSFVGAEKCGECHKKSYEFWKTTSHAHAYESLERGREGEEANWVSRIYDPECLSCHVTGWEPQTYKRFDSGFLNIKTTPHLTGQQCENCHGPGSRHTELELALKESKSQPDDAVIAARKEVQRSMATAEKDHCLHCHDAENSPEFLSQGFQYYWEQIAHPWKD
jgi:hypothetical protein